MKKIKFNVGDRVRVKKVIFQNELKTGMLGTIVSIIEEDGESEFLVKFDNFKGGHAAYDYYSANNVDHDRNDESHWYVPSHQLEKVE